MLEDDFYKKVYKVVRKIPFGQVTTYGAIAKFIGSPSGFGEDCHRNPSSTAYGSIGS